jgi:hypothetical protein
MRKAIEIIREMEKAGLFRRYAVAGGMGAMFYIEPFATYDLDVFVLMDPAPNGLVSLEAIYSWLKERGHLPDKEQVLIAGVPVQFLPAYNALVEEAVEKAKELDLEGTPVRVVSPEHLAAIMLQTGRPKDLARYAEMKEAGALDGTKLALILSQYGLKEPRE